MSDPTSLETSTNMKIGILGGGAAGLSAAYFLAKAQQKSVVLEAGSATGGLAMCHHIDNIVIEKYYHHFFTTDTLVQELLEEWGIRNKLKFYPIETAFNYEGKFYRFTTALDLLKFAPLRFMNRIRLGLNVLNVMKKDNIEEIKKMDAETWLLKEWGPEIYHKLFKPLLKTKFGMSMKDCGAAFVHGRIKARAKTRSKGKELLGYIDGGYETLLSRLHQECEQKGVDIHTNAKINSLRKTAQGWNITYKIKGKNKTIAVEKIINTLPLHIFVSLLDRASLSKEANEELDRFLSIQYQGIICLTIGLKRRLSNFYWTNIISSKLKIGGIIEHTNFISPRHYGNTHLTYLFRYVSPHSRIFGESDKVVTQEFIQDLRQVIPTLRDSDILWTRVARDRCATPIFVKGYEHLMPASKSHIPNMYHSGNAMIYPHSRNVNNVMRISKKTVKVLLEDC